MPFLCAKEHTQTGTDGARSHHLRSVRPWSCPSPHDSSFTARSQYTRPPIEAAGRTRRMEFVGSSLLGRIRYMGDDEDLVKFCLRSPREEEGREVVLPQITI